MKKAQLTLFILMLINTITGQTPFDRGYEIGYEKGYCYNKYGCLSPIAPIAPLPTIYEDQSSYQDGFLRGFTEGQKNNQNYAYKNDNYNQIDFKRLDNDLRLIKYREPESVFNHDLIIKVLLYKQQQYERRIKQLNKSRIKSKNELKKLINFSCSLYDGLLDLVKPNSSLFGQIQILETYLKNSSPQTIVNKYPKSINKKQTNKLITELKSYNNEIKQWTKKVNEEIQFFVDNPNNIIIGIFKVDSIKDYKYNNQSGNYEQYNLVSNPSYIKFEQNRILFKRGDTKSTKYNAIRYWGIKDNHYIFYDGRNQLLAINKELTYINWYYEDNLKGQFLKKSLYYNLTKPKKR